MIGWGFYSVHDVYKRIGRKRFATISEAEKYIEDNRISNVFVSAIPFKEFAR